MLGSSALLTSAQKLHQGPFLELPTFFVRDQVHVVSVLTALALVLDHVPSCTASLVGDHKLVLSSSETADDF